MDYGETSASGPTGFLEKSRLGIDASIRGFASVLQGASGDTITLRLDAADPFDLIDVDATQFKAALLNLVVNAREAMPDRGAVMLSTTIAQIGHDNALSPRLPAGRYAAITVSDCGRGITCDDLDRVFEPFFTGNDVGHGSGLGLSQVYGFATQAGGGIGIVTAIGKGTDVTIYLPLRVRMPACEVGHHAGRRPQRTVLLVEDDDHVRRSTLQAMELLGYRVVAESNGRDALARLQDDDAIDVLFTDIVMPHGMSGITLAREARTLRPGLHILLASGHPRETIESRRADEFAFLAKPYRLQDLASMLKACGGAGLAGRTD